MIDKSKEVANQISDIARKYTRSFFSKLPYFLLIFISLLLVGLSEVIKPDFSFEVFKQASFWYNLLITHLSNFLIAIAALFITSDKIIAIDKNDVIATNTKALNEIAPEIQDKMVDQFIKYTNREIKKEIYIVRLHNKLLRLEKRKRRYKTIKKYADYCNEQDEEKRSKLLKTRYVRKRIFYETRMQTDFLEKNIDAIKVRNCPKLSRSFLTVGSHSQYQSDFPTPNSIIVMRGLLPKFAFWISITILFFMFGVDFQKIGWLSIFTLSFRMIGLVLNYIFGSRYGETYVNESVIDVLYMRIRWLVRFKEWKENEIKKQKLEIEIQKHEQFVDEKNQIIETTEKVEVEKVEIPNEVKNEALN